MSTYIYAITQADHPMRLEGLYGVGDPPGQLRTLKAGGLGAVVSEAPAGLRAKRRDLVAHQAVLERLMGDGAALPMRFGLVGPGDDQVLSVLEERRETYANRLADIDGCLEVNLKASRDEDDLLREIVEQSPEIRQLNEVTRRNPDAADEKMRLGELISQEIQQRHARQSEELVALLLPRAVEHSMAEPAQEHFLNVSFLVKREEAAAFSQAVQEEAERRGDKYALNLHGPLPPYSFV